MDSTRERVDTDSSVKRLFIRSSFETDTERAERAEKAEGGGRGELRNPRFGTHVPQLIQNKFLCTSRIDNNVAPEEGPNIHFNLQHAGWIALAADAARTQTQRRTWA